MSETPPPAQGAQGVPAAPPGAGAPPAPGARPRFSETQAAKVTGKSRSVIQRAREKGAFPNAERLDKGWAIPVEDLLAAGFDIINGHGRPIDSPPAQGAQGVPAAPPGAGGAPAQSNAEVHRLQEELHRREVELAAEKARREVLEQAAIDARRAFESYQAQLERSFRLIEAAQAEASQARAEAQATQQSIAPEPQPDQLLTEPAPASTPPDTASITSHEPELAPTSVSSRVRRWWRT